MPPLVQLSREIDVLPDAEYLLEVEHVRKAFPGVVASMTWHSG